MAAASARRLPLMAASSREARIKWLGRECEHTIVGQGNHREGHRGDAAHIIEAFVGELGIRGAYTIGRDACDHRPAPQVITPRMAQLGGLVGPRGRGSAMGG